MAFKDVLLIVELSCNCCGDHKCCFSTQNFVKTCSEASQITMIGANNIFCLFFKVDSDKLNANATLLTAQCKHADDLQVQRWLSAPCYNSNFVNQQ